MISKIWLLNIVLALGALFLGLRAYGVWSEMEKGVDLSRVTGKPVHRAAASEYMLSKRNTTPESDFEIIVSRNLFSPERREAKTEPKNQPNEEKEPSAAEKKNLEKSLEQITLYGVMITDDLAEALVSVMSKKRVPVRRNSRKTRIIQSKADKWVEVGDMVGDFEVSEINPEGLVLKAGSVTFDLLLYEAGKVRKRAPAKPKASPTVVGVLQQRPVQGGKNQEKPKAAATGGAKALKPGLPSRAAPSGDAARENSRRADFTRKDPREAFEKMLKRKKSSTP